MKKLLLLLLLTASCVTEKQPKFSIWTVVEKYEASDTGCVYYWDRGRSYFTDGCNKYSVGDTIKHQ